MSGWEMVISLQYQWGMSMQVIIKEYDKRDEHQLSGLADLSFEDEGVLNIVKNSTYKFAISAFVEDKLIGVSFGWISKFHPYCTYFRILSHPLYAESRVVEKLLAQVEGLGKDVFPLQTSIWETSINVRNIYECNGFKEIRRTYMPTLQVSDLKNDIQFDDEDHYTIKTLAEISSNHVLMEKLALLVKKNYEATHEVNPVVNAGLHEWKKLISENDIVRNGSYVYLEAGGSDIAAYSFLHESDEENAYELGWCGSLDKGYKKLIPQLVLRQIKYAMKNQVETILGEFDTTDSYAIEILKTFPFAPCPTWMTYQKK